MLPLTPTHRRFRLEWCRTRGNWTEAEWNLVVFSEESRFNLSNDDNCVRGPRRECLNPAFALQRHTAPTADVMVFFDFLIIYLYQTVNDEQAADLLGLHYQKISRLNFSVEDRNIKIRASRIVHGCCSDTHRGTSIFSRDFRVNELEAAIGDSCLNKSPGPDGIHGQMIDHLGLSGRQRFLDIINCSWNKLPRDWKRATVIPIKCGKTDGTSESFRPIALTSIACKIMAKMVLRRLTFQLHSHNLLPEEQYGFREEHCTTDQLLYFCQRIRDAHNRKPANHTVAIFLDLSKAFF
ncbi:putative RNA-directed DNA polymerase from transposon BS [Trichonephila clavipes]|nr:putative RNA-directed DNA polymerase from transposon BS [Trichonephila clavipes]